ncbi:unnamed protein product [Trichogramma brassicae]|uniref:Uncharacterized protein n=1 Tax=Trichogramma brassicae TaxID=86971 RepID=A0A6H5IGT0_9HYME|nr:unnamed protein product [Trichogramma brassicae]
MNDYGIATVRECRILINRSVFYCGMHSHILTVANGEVLYYKEVTRDECERMHATGSYTYQNLVINDIPRNGSITTPHTFGGTSGEFGKCTAESRYVDAYGTFHDVVVQGFIKIDMQSYTAKVDMEADKLQLVSGASCTASSRHCVSPDGSEAYWSTVEMGECGINKYSIIYDGYINKIEDLEEENVVYMLSTQDRNFALVRKFEENVCGIVIQHTEHTRLMIIESSSRHALMRQTEIIAHNIDLFEYTNAKFLLVELANRIVDTALVRRDLEVAFRLVQRRLGMSQCRGNRVCCTLGVIHRYKRCPKMVTSGVKGLIQLVKGTRKASLITTDLDRDNIDSCGRPADTTKSFMNLELAIFTEREQRDETIAMHNNHF